MNKQDPKDVALQEEALKYIMCEVSDTLPEDTYLLPSGKLNAEILKDQGRAMALNMRLYVLSKVLAEDRVDIEVQLNVPAGFRDYLFRSLNRILKKPWFPVRYDTYAKKQYYKVSLNETQMYRDVKLRKGLRLKVEIESSVEGPLTKGEAL